MKRQKLTTYQRGFIAVEGFLLVVSGIAWALTFTVDEQIATPAVAFSLWSIFVPVIIGLGIWSQRGRR